MKTRPRPTPTIGERRRGRGRWPDEADPEIAAILDGPSPDVPPSAPIAPPPDFAVQSFNEAVDALKKLVTKPAAQFVTTTPVDDLMKVIAFLQAVFERASANQTKQRDKQ